MSQTLQLPNYPAMNVKERSTLMTDAATGATTLNVGYSDQLLADTYIVLGRPGDEGCELAQIASVTDADTIVLQVATTRPHLTNEAITALVGNKMKIYRAANSDGTAPADAAFSVIDTINIDIDQSQTTYTDTTGTSGYWYKFTYYNSTSNTETSLAAALAARGGGVGNYTSIEAVRKEAGFGNAAYITDAMVDAKRQAAQSEMNAALGGFYTVPFTAPINPYIADIATRLAAGFLMDSQFGEYDTTSKALAKNKIDAARADYDKLVSGSMVLKDENGSALIIGNTTGGSIGVGSWPNNTTPALQSSLSDGTIIAGSGDFNFRINDKY